MKVEQIQIHNVRCIKDMTLKLDDYLLLVGANNSGKSTVIHALRLFFSDELWVPKRDVPLQEAQTPGMILNQDIDSASWVRVTYGLSGDEVAAFHKYLLPDTSEQNASVLPATGKKSLVLKRYFSWPGTEDTRMNSTLLQLFAVVGENEISFMSEGWPLFPKLGNVIYIPATVQTEDQLNSLEKTSFRGLVNQLVVAKIKDTDAFGRVKENLAALNKIEPEAKSVFEAFEQKLNKNLQNWKVNATLELDDLKVEDLLRHLLRAVNVK